MSRRVIRWRVLVAATVTPFAVSCGGSQTVATAPEPTASAPAAPAAAPVPTLVSSSTAAPPAASAQPDVEGAWKDMTVQQRKKYMASVVLPKMKENFVAFDAKAYGNMNCATCHGAGAQDGSFKMPNPQLPKLPSEEAGFKALMKKRPEAMKFMGSKVVPDMAHLVGEPPYDPETKQGFGCFECHTKK